MENYFEISIGHGEDLKTFEVKDYAHHEGDQCKFEVFSSGKLVLSLEPDGHFLRTCQNPGALDEDISLRFSWSAEWEEISKIRGARHTAVARPARLRVAIG